MLYAPNGQLIPSSDKPKLTDRGTLEGTAEFKFYRNAVEYGVRCVHCTGLIGGVLHIEDPRLAKTDRTWDEKVELQNECIRLAKMRHQCSVWQENKKDADQWLREVSQ